VLGNPVYMFSFSENSCSIWSATFVAVRFTAKLPGSGQRNYCSLIAVNYNDRPWQRDYEDGMVAVIAISSPVPVTAPPVPGIGSECPKVGLFPFTNVDRL
jgi:hypothetical protein